MTIPPSVLHLCSIKGRGGTGYMASRLARLSAELGCRVTVGSCPGSKIEERARAAGLQTLDGLALRRGFRPLPLARDIALIRKFVRDQKITIIHAWHSIEYWTAALALIGLPCHLVRTRGLVTPVKASIVNRLIHRRTSLLHVTCRAIEENYQRAGFPMDRVKLVYDGVDIKRFHPAIDGCAVRKELGIPADAPVLASVGRLEKVKGHTCLLHALELIKEEIPGLHLIMAGDGSQRPLLEAQLRASGLADRVHLLGVRSDIPAILAACDLYLLTSIGSEGSSRATQEAMACGRPVLTSRVGMLPDIVRNGETGALVPMEDPRALSVALLSLLSNRENLQTMGRKARAWVEEDFDEQIFAQRIVSLYRELLER